MSLNIGNNDVTKPLVYPVSRKVKVNILWKSNPTSKKSVDFTR
ncbi:hypothetical protein [Lacrimispora aerotolerans]|jgi:hypothetical protein|nr:hypothetical protein [Lacrimispora aerotolerans]